MRATERGTPVVPAIGNPSSAGHRRKVEARTYFSFGSVRRLFYLRAKTRWGTLSASPNCVACCRWLLLFWSGLLGCFLCRGLFCCLLGCHDCCSPFFDLDIEAAINTLQLTKGIEINKKSVKRKINFYAPASAHRNRNSHQGSKPFPFCVVHQVELAPEARSLHLAKAVVHSSRKDQRRK